MSDSAGSHRPPPWLWYDRPGTEVLTEGLPIGNGKLGALILGGAAGDRWALNESTLWNGGPYDPTHPDALAALPEVRRLIWAGEYQAAATLAEAKLIGVPKCQLAYQPLADLLLEFPGHEVSSEYRRELDLDRALVTVEYVIGSVRFTREVFASAADQVLVARFRCSRPAGLNCVLNLRSEQQSALPRSAPIEPSYGEHGFGMRGRNRADQGIEGALSFELRAELRRRDGRAMPGEGQLSVRDATELVLVCAAATSYVSFKDVSADPAATVAARLSAVRELGFEELLERHVADHQPRFRRVSVELGPAAAGRFEPTDARIASFREDRDPALAALYVQYARYLLLACSRADSQPANLQGLWNDKLYPPWGSKCTININMQMNYWPAQAGALPECCEPLFALLEDLSETGANTARRHYGASGWVAHHNVDLWRATAPVDGAEWGLWPMGGAWLCLHLWDHYRYTLSKDYLARAYPLLKGACEFFLDTLLPDPETGHAVTCPSLSPENRHPYGTTLCAGPTMDAAILRDLFDATREAARLLNVDLALAENLARTRERLPPYRIGHAGQLQEWQKDWDLEAPEPSHRHVSHLFGLHPSHQISPAATPDLARAARRTLELRGDAATGWSLAWKVNLWARLHEGDRLHELLELLLSPERSYTNLFDAHPPFQIDGNFGGAAGILEALVQSDLGRLHLLPALPRYWSQGRVAGIRARGGLTITLRWHDGELSEALVSSVIDQAIEVRIQQREPIRVSLAAGVETPIPL